MAQVKFYATPAASYAALVSANTVDQGGVYFVEGGELYKGASRFGANKVFSVSSADDLASVSGQIGGDIAVGFGAAKVWDAAQASWRDLSADNAALKSMWQADISTWTAGLVQSGEGSYITSITQGADGKVTASASNFATDVKTAIGDGSATSTANGITVDVVTTSGSVTSVSVSAANISATSVTADSGTFTNLTVSDTATFNATTVSASTLTVGGIAVNNIAASTATSTASGVAVTVSTANGGVKEVTVGVTKADLNTALGLSAFADKSVVTVIGPSTGEGAASNDNIPTEAAVRAALTSFDNAMHFVGAGTSLPASAVAGDVYVFTADATDESGYKSGQEVVYTGSAWEVIGDQNTYATKVTVDALASRVTDIEGIVDASASSVSASAGSFGTLTASTVSASSGTFETLTVSAATFTATTVSADSLTVGGSTIEQLADKEIAAIAEASKSDADKGVTVEVVTQSGSVKSVDVAVVASSAMAFNDAGSADVLATTAAVKSFYDNNLVWLDANGSAIS